MNFLGMTSYGLMSLPGSSNDVSGAAIAGIVVGIILVAVLVTMATIFCQRRGNKNEGGI